MCEDDSLELSEEICEDDSLELSSFELVDSLLVFSEDDDSEDEVDETSLEGTLEEELLGSVFTGPHDEISKSEINIGKNVLFFIFVLFSMIFNYI